MKKITQKVQNIETNKFFDIKILTRFEHFLFSVIILTKPLKLQNSKVPLSYFCSYCPTFPKIILNSEMTMENLLL